MKRMRAYSVTVTMTPRQAVEAERALHEAAIGKESARLFSAARRITNGLFDAGWSCRNVGTDDEPRWVWEYPEAVA